MDLPVLVPYNFMYFNLVYIYNNLVGDILNNAMVIIHLPLLTIMTIPSLYFSLFYNFKNHNMLIHIKNIAQSFNCFICV